MTNAKKELIKQLKHLPKVICAIVNDSVLKVNHSEKDFEEFLNSLDFEYDEGFGTQYVHGMVWLEDGTWLDRLEYDGQESWTHEGVPEIPEECL